MKIVLLRHGKPDVPDHGKLKACEIHQWVALYNAAGLVADHTPSREAIDIAKSCNSVVCSDLPRSIESAQTLGFNKEMSMEPLFREMELPNGSFPSFRLPPTIWAAFFRILWFLGYAPNTESVSEARIRAFNAANRLTEIASSNKSVLLVGHGVLNRFIAKELISTGWKGPDNPGRQYWEFGIYEYMV